jgi:methylenetetrahydrofolate dehydrogenase (NADP+)/methenyltetrahydrofolate cyclohydrolase
MVIGDSSGFTPCTPAGIMEMFTLEDIPLSGKVVCVLGRSNIVGKPMISLLTNA